MSKIFISYRRDDVPGDARGICDGMVARFGRANVFMDVDNLIVGQRFDSELAKALDDCNVLIAIIGPRWLELLRSRLTGSERDYVREEIAEALRRKVAVVPVRVGREGNMHALPRSDELPEDIRDFVLYQRHDVAHERFGRDVAELTSGIVTLRKSLLSSQSQSAFQRLPWGWIGGGLAILAATGGSIYFYVIQPASTTTPSAIRQFTPPNEPQPSATNAAPPAKGGLWSLNAIAPPAPAPAPLWSLKAPAPAPAPAPARLWSLNRPAPAP